MRWVGLLPLCFASACTIGGVNALPPLDADTAIDGGAGSGADAAGDGGCIDCCQPGFDTDGDSVDDCDELDDGDPFTDPAVFNGLTASIGDRPEVTGTCGNLDDYDEMVSRFDTATNVMKVYAGWEFDTGADNYADASYGFMPNWTTSDGGRFSVRYSGRINLTDSGTHCFRIDIGATGTGIISGKNMCAQVYVDAGPGGSWLVESGYQAESSDANEACVTLDAGDYTLDIVFWYFNVLEQAQLQVRRCFGGQSSCSPDQAIDPTAVQAP